MNYLENYTIVDLDLDKLLLGLSLSIFCSFILAWVVKKHSRLLTDRDQFKVLFFIIIPTMVLIISVVKSSLALSLGLVGALSIVRFRTPIKEPEELVYLFFAIATGLGLGSGQILATMISFIFIIFIMICLGLVRSKGISRGVFLDIQDNSSQDFLHYISRILPLLKEIDCLSEIRRAELSKNEINMTLYIETEDHNQVINLLSKLKKTFSSANITLIDRSRQLS